VKIPTRFQLGAHEIEVVRKEDLINHAESYGLFDPDRLKIYIDTRLEDSSLAWEVFFHEVTEMLNHFSEAGMEHKTIQVWGVWLHQIFMSGDFFDKPAKKK
jgi:hypothetical protein